MGPSAVQGLLVGRNAALIFQSCSQALSSPSPAPAAAGGAGAPLGPGGQGSGSSMQAAARPSQTVGTAVAEALAALRGLCLLVVLMEQAVADHVPPLMVLLTAGVNRAAACLEMQMQVRSS